MLNWHETCGNLLHIMKNKLIRLWGKITGRRNCRLAVLRKIRADRDFDRLERTLEAKMEGLAGGEERRECHSQLLKLRMSRVLARGKRRARFFGPGVQNEAMLDFARRSLLKPA